MVKNPPASAGDIRDVGFMVGKIPWRREWPPTAVFLPREFHGRRRLAGYRPCGCKELDTTECLTFSLLVSPFTTLLTQA